MKSWEAAELEKSPKLPRENVILKTGSDVISRGKA